MLKHIFTIEDNSFEASDAINVTILTNECSNLTALERFYMPCLLTINHGPDLGGKEFRNMNINLNE